MSEDGREHVRAEAVLELEYSYESFSSQVRVEDISEGGAFVETPNPHREGDEIKFKLTLPDAGEPIVGKAVVVWRQPTVGMGIRFIGLTEEQREQIKFFVAAQFFKSF